MNDARFYIVDVFTGTPFKGNPVAVVLAGELDSERMQAISAWTGMPETVFVTTPTRSDADYAVRIFSPRRELPFAGHPSIEACHTLLEEGHIAHRRRPLLQPCPAGLFEMMAENEGASREISFRVSAGEVARVEGEVGERVARALGRWPSRAYLANAGVRWITARFDDPAELAATIPDADAICALSEELGVLGVSAFSPSPDPDAQYEIRSFAPAIGVLEDAVCGGGNGCVAATVAHEAGGGLGCANYVASQGRHLGRRGRVRIKGPDAAGLLTIGGQCVTTGRGSIRA